MDQTDPHRGYFVVSAKSSGGFIQQTRKADSSAIVLALSWRDAAHTDITVTDPSGRRVPPEGYRDEALQRLGQGLHSRSQPRAEWSLTAEGKRFQM